MAGLKVGVQKNRPLSQIITLTITGRGKQYNEPNDSNLHNRKTKCNEEKYMVDRQLLPGTTNRHYIHEILVEVE
jgi:hypothetical protein